MLLKKKHKKTVTQVNRDKSPPSVWGDILYLVSKLLMVGFVLATLYFFVFGLLRYNDDGMKPALKDGDLVVYYRLDKRYSMLFLPALDDGVQARPHGPVAHDDQVRERRALLDHGADGGVGVVGAVALVHGHEHGVGPLVRTHRAPLPVVMTPIVRSRTRVSVLTPRWRM